MGRMWNALNRSDSSPGGPEEECTRPAPIGDAEPMLVAEDEIPFIEVGPRKSIEASPSVLACSPNTAMPSLTLRASGRVTAEPPAPRIVPFRTVFLATPEMECETPQDDPAAQRITFL